MLDVRTTLMRAADVLDRSASTMRSAVDRHASGDPAAASDAKAELAAAVADARAGSALLEGLGTRHHAAATQVRSMADRLDPVIRPNVIHGRGNSDVDDVPGRLAVRAAALRTEAGAIGRSPSDVRRELLDRVDAIATQADGLITPDDMLRLAAISQLPDDLRPAMAAATSPMSLRLDDLVAQRVDPSNDASAFAAIERLRVDATRRELAADPTVTPLTLDAELRAILTTPDELMTIDHVRRLAVLGGLPDDLRPALMDIRIPTRLPTSELSLGKGLPRTDDVVRANVTAIRLTVDADNLAARAGITSDSVLTQLHGLLQVPTHAMTTDHMRSLGTLVRLPNHVRPPMPGGPAFRHLLEDITADGQLPRRSYVARAALDQLLDHTATMRAPDGAAAALRRQIDSGEAISLRSVEALSNHPHVLERHGLTPDVLHTATVRALAGSSAGSALALRHGLAAVRDALQVRRTETSALDELRRHAIHLADRNLARIDGVRTDTYGRHPDYAEIGRITSIAQLFDATPSPGTSSARTDAVMW